MKIVIISKFNCQSFPLNGKAIEINEEILNEIGKTKCFDVENNCVVDYDNSNDLKEQEKQKRILELTYWFDDYFHMQLGQHFWQKDYKPSADPYFKNEDGNPKTYETFEDIIAQAEIVREEIKKLRS